ncbi:MAG TPA: hypothetical protein VK821_02300 [Dehalococcoidia bacterium]|nr:hypothetical protein [Dehalococcoidia bacterium]
MDAPGMRREDFHALWQRLMRVARLDATAFLEVRDDPAATWPAIVVVAVASLLSGLGGWLLFLSSSSSRLSFAIQGLSPFAQSFAQSAVGATIRDAGATYFLRSAIVGSVLAILLWFGWVAITAVMLERVWHRNVQFLSLVRTMGLAFFPVGLSLLMIIDPIAIPIAVISLAAAVLLSGVAVEASTEAEPAEILFSNLVGFAVFAIVLGLLGRSGGYAPGLFSLPV